MIRICSVLVALICFYSNAQNVSKEDMKLVLSKMNEAYSTSKSYSMTVHHSSYAGHSSDVSIEEYTGSFLKSGDNYYSNLLDVETIQNKSAKVSVSNNQKVVIISNCIEFSKAVVDKEYLDHVLDQASKIEVSNAGNTRTYKFYMKNNGEFESYLITLNDKYFMTKLVMNYRQERSWKNKSGKEISGKPKLVVSYSNIKINTVVDASKFNFNKYIIESGESYQLTPKYASYTLNDNRIKLKK